MDAEAIIIAVPSIIVGAFVLCCCICCYKSCEVDHTYESDIPPPVVNIH